MKFKVGDLVIPNPDCFSYSVMDYRKKCIAKVIRTSGQYIDLKCISSKCQDHIGYTNGGYSKNLFMSINEAVKQGCFYEKESATLIEPRWALRETIDEALLTFQANMNAEPITIQHTFNTANLRDVTWFTDGTGITYHE